MLKLTVLLVALFGCALAGPIDIESRIVGGFTAGVGQFPYQVSMRSAANAHFCGGSIHNNRWVITVAHCTVGRTTANTRVVVAAHSRTDGISHTVAQIRNHPNYNANTIAMDIATVQTAGAITLNARAAVIPLGLNFVGGGVAAVVSGWGQTAHPGSGSANLMGLNTQVLGQADCRSRHGGNGHLVFDHKICTLTAVNQGVCMGDSGGPVVVGNQLHGAVSWVIACARGFPDVHDRISVHRPWLLANMP